MRVTIRAGLLVVVTMACLGVAKFASSSDECASSGDVRAVVLASNAEFQQLRIHWATSDTPVTLHEMVELWRSGLGAWFSSVLAAAPFDSFYWECPPSTVATFEFMIVRARRFGPADPSDFGDRLRCADDGVVSFPNLGRDAMLVAPCELHGVQRNVYGHIANFVRGAPATQLDQFWKHVADTYAAVVAQRAPHPVWLSTAGSGVPWLHVRLDARPKYYHTKAYRKAVTT